jgi:hypothetical protein
MQIEDLIGVRCYLGPSASVVVGFGEPRGLCRMCRQSHCPSYILRQLNGNAWPTPFRQCHIFDSMMRPVPPNRTMREWVPHLDRYDRVWLIKEQRIALILAMLCSAESMCQLELGMSHDWSRRQIDWIETWQVDRLGGGFNGYMLMELLNPLPDLNRPGPGSLKIESSLPLAQATPLPRCLQLHALP